MQIYLSNSGQEPIYAQITRQIKQQILSGALRPGDALPSIRLLAKELRISVITTASVWITRIKSIWRQRCATLWAMWACR